MVGEFCRCFWLFSAQSEPGVESARALIRFGLIPVWGTSLVLAVDNDTTQRGSADGEIETPQKPRGERRGEAEEQRRRGGEERSRGAESERRREWDMEGSNPNWLQTNHRDGEPSARKTPHRSIAASHQANAAYHSSYFSLERKHFMILGGDFDPASYLEAPI